MNLDDLQRQQVPGILGDDVVSAALECGRDDVVVLCVRAHEVDLIGPTRNMRRLKQRHEEVTAVLPDE